jgi:catechol-2,3-dioxygenase
MRRTTGFDQADIVPYYTDVVGLPLMRVGPDVSLLWAGEDIVFEIKTRDEPGRRDAALDVAPLLPIFRSHDLALTRARFERAGHTAFSEDATDFARRLWVVGPDGLSVGFEQISEQSPFEADQIALQRWLSGPPGLDGVAALPPDLQYLSRVRRRVADVERMRAFYRDVAGFDEVGTDGDTVLFSLGDTVLLELVGQGNVQPTPSNRVELIDSFIMRSHDFDDCVAALSADGATWVGEQIRYETGSNLAYFGDPEGLVVGFEERSDYGEYVDDIEANRRWQARTS